MDVAERHLRRAEAKREEGDFGNAYAAAVEAFEAVAPHADGHDGCRLALTRSKRLIAELAKKQNANTDPKPVPTLFE